MKGPHVGQAAHAKAGSGETPRMQGWKEGKMRVGWTDREPGNRQGDGMGGEISEPSWFGVHSIGHGLCPEDCG